MNNKNFWLKKTISLVLIFSISSSVFMPTFVQAGNFSTNSAASSGISDFFKAGKEAFQSAYSNFSFKSLGDRVVETLAYLGYYSEKGAVATGNGLSEAGKAIGNGLSQAGKASVPVFVSAGNGLLQAGKVAGNGILAAGKASAPVFVGAGNGLLQAGKIAGTGLGYAGKGLWGATKFAGAGTYNILKYGAYYPAKLALWDAPGFVINNTVLKPTKFVVNNTIVKPVSFFTKNFKDGLSGKGLPAFLVRSVGNIAAITAIAAIAAGAIAATTFAVTTFASGAIYKQKVRPWLRTYAEKLGVKIDDAKKEKRDKKLFEEETALLKKFSSGNWFEKAKAGLGLLKSKATGLKNGVVDYFNPSQLKDDVKAVKKDLTKQATKAAGKLLAKVEECNDFRAQPENNSKKIRLECEGEKSASLVKIKKKNFVPVKEVKKEFDSSSQGSNKIIDDSSLGSPGANFSFIGPRVLEKKGSTEKRRNSFCEGQKKLSIGSKTVRALNKAIKEEKYFKENFSGTYYEALRKAKILEVKSPESIGVSEGVLCSLKKDFEEMERCRKNISGVVAKDVAEKSDSGLPGVVGKLFGESGKLVINEAKFRGHNVLVLGSHGVCEILRRFGGSIFALCGGVAGASAGLAICGSPDNWSSLAGYSLTAIISSLAGAGVGGAAGAGVALINNSVMDKEDRLEFFDKPKTRKEITKTAVGGAFVLALPPVMGSCATCIVGIPMMGHFMAKYGPMIFLKIIFNGTCTVVKCFAATTSAVGLGGLTLVALGSAAIFGFDFLNEILKTKFDEKEKAQNAKYENKKIVGDGKPGQVNMMAGSKEYKEFETWCKNESEGRRLLKEREDKEACKKEMASIFDNAEKFAFKKENPRIVEAQEQSRKINEETEKLWVPTDEQVISTIKKEAKTIAGFYWGILKNQANCCADFYVKKPLGFLKRCFEKNKKTELKLEKLKTE